MKSSRASLLLVWILAPSAAFWTSGCHESSRPAVRVLSDRTPSHLEPLFEAFTKTTGIAVHAVYVDKGLVSRLESRPTEADLVISKDAELLELAREKGLLQPYRSARVDSAVPAEFRDRHGMYVSGSYRARVIFYSKERVRPSQLSTYQDLADPRWRGKICIRSGYHDYNISLFSQMLAHDGEEKTRAFLRGLADNLARTPVGNDRAQAKAISQGVCDVALMNTYYMGIMLANPEQRAWGEATRIFFPDQSGCGAYILRSGLGLTKATRNVEGARALLEYLVQPSVQEHLTKLTYAYPVSPNVPWPQVVKRFGQGQPGIRDGRFKACRVPLDQFVKRRAEVVKILDEVRFDRPR